MYRTISESSGGHSSGEIPVPIPNTEVKSTASKILTWRRVGKIDTARFKEPQRKNWGSFFAWGPLTNHFLSVNFKK